MKLLIVTFYIVAVVMLVALVYLAFTSDQGVGAAILALIWGAALVVIARMTLPLLLAGPPR
jgi:hypothetical protein